MKCDSANVSKLSFVGDSWYNSSDILCLIDLDGEGNIISTISENDINIDADVDYIWDISLDSQAIGNWYVYGELEGNVIVDAQWGSGEGTVDIELNDPGLFHDFIISYNDLSLTLTNITPFSDVVKNTVILSFLFTPKIPSIK